MRNAWEPELGKKKLKPWEWSLLVILLALLISGGIVIADTSLSGTLTYPRSVADDRGNTIILDHAPVQIVSLAPSNTELLFSLGLGERIAGVTDYCNYPDEATGKKKIGGFSTVSLEKVTALQPDLIVAADGNSEDTITRLRELGFPVYLVDAGSMNDILKTIKNLGYLTDTTDHADDLITNLTVRSAEVKKQGEAMVSHPTIAHVIWNDPVYVSGGNTFQDEVIRLSGGVNIFSNKEGHAIAGIEEFVSLNPDILMINSGKGMGKGNESGIEAYFRSEPRLSSLKAIKENKIIIVDQDVADRASPRLWDLLEEVAPRIRGGA